VSDFQKAAAFDTHGDMGELALGNIRIVNGALSGKPDEILDGDRRFLESHPLDTTAMEDLAWWQYLAGRPEDSAATSLRLLELNPAFAAQQAQYSDTLLQMGKHVEALSAAQRESDEGSKLEALTCVYWAMGRRAESDAALGALEKGFGHRNEYIVAAVHAYRGEADAAFSWLERARQQRRGTLFTLKFDPRFRKLHGDPRFDAFLRKVKLVE
jgi:tetratricopeptide (TPR) repeat protein